MASDVLSRRTGIAHLFSLWRGGLDVIQGRITLGQLVQFTAYLAQLTWPMIAFGWVVNLFQQGSASMIRINEVMDHEPTIASPGEAGIPVPQTGFRKGDPYKYHPSREKKGRGDVEFRHVSFAYGEREVLHDINIQVKAGSSLAVAGPTGSGKSTLVSLLARVFDVTTLWANV